MDFKSPWLQFERPRWPSLEAANHTEKSVSDVAIIGAGISGVATLYFLLTQTNKTVVLLEKDQVASGATGNNAGIVAAYIEKPIAELIAEFGVDKTKQTYSEIDGGWDLLSAILDDIDETENFIPFTQGALGFAAVENLIHSITQEKIHSSFGRAKWKYLAVDDESIKQRIPNELIKYIRFVTRKEILSTLKIIAGNYMAAAIPVKNLIAGRINSAKLCYKILAYLSQKYPDRFAIYENTNINKIEVSSSHALLHHANGKIKVEDVIMCTNGYKDFHIIDHAQQTNITKLNNAITVREGYLSAYIDAVNTSENYSAGFWDEHGPHENVPYFYISNAPIPTQLDTNMVLIGGPEYDLPWPCPEALIKEHAQASFEINKEFIKNEINSSIDSVDYFWRGLMAYTDNGLRWVGRDSAYPHIWYNTGCNGIGVLHAISGAEKIAAIMQGKTYPPSLFDPE